MAHLRTQNMVKDATCRTCKWWLPISGGLFVGRGYCTVADWREEATAVAVDKNFHRQRLVTDPRHYCSMHEKI